MHLVIFPVFKEKEQHLGVVLHIVLHGTYLIIGFGSALKISCLRFDQLFIDAVHLGKIVPLLPGNPYVEDKSDKSKS